MRGFDKEPTSERPTASVDQVWRLAALMPRRFRALVIFAAFTGLRWGELVALRMRDVDLDTGVVHVVRKFAELQNGERVPGRPKSDAGFRTVALPSVLVAVVREHLAEFPPSDPEDLIFKRPMGAALRRNNFHRSVRWAECVAEAGLPEASGSTICATRETRWRPRRGRAHGS